MAGIGLEHTKLLGKNHSTNTPLKYNNVKLNSQAFTQGILTSPHNPFLLKNELMVLVQVQEQDLPVLVLLCICKECSTPSIELNSIIPSGSYIYSLYNLRIVIFA